MRWKKRRLWPLAVLGALALMLMDLGWGGGVAQARGGRGGRGGGRGGRGGRGTPSPNVGGGGTGTARNNERKEAQELERRQERAARVELARLEYAKRERQQLWDAETRERLASAMNKVLGSSSE
jgi:hypothetical protein